MYLFLDFDGVLNNEPFLRHQKNHREISGQKLFDPNNMASLNHFLRNSNIKNIVISSSWRLNRSLKELQNLLDIGMFEFSGFVVGATEILGRRENEINLYVKEHNISNFLVLDDQALDISKKHFFKVNSNTGLTLENAKLLINAREHDQ